jgi:hypothetical protein
VKKEKENRQKRRVREKENGQKRRGRERKIVDRKVGEEREREYTVKERKREGE